MATAKLWSNVGVSMQSALATAVTTSAITNANPGVVTHAGTGPADGAYVVTTVQGMTQINNRVFRAANEATTTFELEGEDTTNYGVYSSGSFQVITFGTTVGTVRGLTASGGDYDFIDTTTIHDTIATQIPGLANPSTFTFENIWDVSDSALIAMKSASDLKTLSAFKFTFSDGQIMVFNGYVGASLLPGGSAQDLVTTESVITMFGSPTYYAA